MGTNRALCSHVHVAADHRSIIISTWVTCDDPPHKVWLIPGQLTKIVSDCDMVLPLLVSQKTPNTGDTGADDNWATLKTCSQKFLPAPAACTCMQRQPRTICPWRIRQIWLTQHQEIRTDCDKTRKYKLKNNTKQAAKVSSYEDQQLQSDLCVWWPWIPVWGNTAEGSVLIH